MSISTANWRDIKVPSPLIIDDVPWVILQEGYGLFGIKILRADLRENSLTLIARWSAGVVVPKHRHFGAVHAFTLTGRWHYAEYDWFATAGSYVMETPETEHTLIVDEDTEAIFIQYGGQVDIGPNGEVLRYQDTQTALEAYIAGLEAIGLELPAGIVVT